MASGDFIYIKTLLTEWAYSIAFPVLSRAKPPVAALFGDR